ncbi:hypothetical protein NUW54_g4830 [Trametes sanguinea]|uniref:Uncharacterized protein n=1 Tax=Trametes sanguinea TaxID=158606 RepID=A0ACC1PWV1_9APHY|nr:hypothetical protein NUW54_g4830 [Trametes sanguinea]
MGLSTCDHQLAMTGAGGLYALSRTSLGGRCMLCPLVASAPYGKSLSTDVELSTPRSHPWGWLAKPKVLGPNHVIRRFPIPFPGRSREDFVHAFLWVSTVRPSIFGFRQLLASKRLQATHCSWPVIYSAY